MITDISSWEEKRWFSTGGTRAKKYVEAPCGLLYYFKQSEKKLDDTGTVVKEYKHEFWSEVIASRVGILLGFDVLKYEPAIDHEVMGCLCADMIQMGEEELIMGVQYLQGFDPSFEPELKAHRPRYTFAMIEQALNHYSIQDFIVKMVELLVFDAVIGNVDRHQENWAFIQQISSITRIVISATEPNDGFREVLLNTPLIRDRRIREPNKLRFAPFFDNGSSLGRELTDERIDMLLLNLSMLENYVSRSPSEIRIVEGKKQSHFDILHHLCLKDKYKEIVHNVIKRVCTQFDGSKIESIFAGLDTEVPEECAYYRMSSVRKEFLYTLLTMRCKKLSALL